MTRSMMKLAILTLTIGLAIQSATAQENRKGPEGSFNVTIHLVAGSATQTDGAVTGRLAGVFNRLGEGLGLKSYKVLATQRQNLAYGGSVQSNAVFDALGSYSIDKRKILASWNAGPVEPSPGGENEIALGRFQFNSRVPVAVGEALEYQELKYMITRTRIPVGSAALIGNLPVPDTGDVLLFVIEVERAK